MTWISSGTPEKHNDLADIASVAVPVPQDNTTLSKTASPTAATANGTINYTITATNNSGVDVFLDSFKDTLPTGVTYVNNSSQYAAVALANPTIAGQMLTWSSVFRVPANGTASLTYQATLPANITCQTFINSAVAFVGVAGVGFTPVQIDTTLATNDNSPATATVADTNCAADLSITKTDGSATYTPGNAISYTIVVSNSGPLTATGVSIADTVPAAIMGVTRNCVASGTASCGTDASAGNNISFTGASINAGAANFLTITVSGTVSAMATGNLDNTATVTPGGQSDPNTNNNSATDSDTSSALADLVVTKTDGVMNVNAGGTTTYTVVVTNNGPSPANNAIFKDPAATGLSATSVTCGSAAGGAACPAMGNTTVALMQGAGIIIPTLPSGGSVTFTILASVTATSGTVTNTVTVDPPAGTTDPTPATAMDTDTVDPRADLVVTKSDGVTNVNAGGATTYTVTLTNNGPSPANGATISDPAQRV